LRRTLARIGRLMVPSVARVLWARGAAEAELSAPVEMSANTRVSPNSQAAASDVVASARQARALYRRALRSAFRDPLTVGDLAIDGEDLRHGGVAPGKAMGDMLKHLLDVVLADPARNTREALLAEVRTQVGGAA
jgi:hypothetical protein